MRWPLLAATAAMLAGFWACRSAPVTESRFPSGTPRRCVYLQVDNQNLNRAKIYLSEGHVKVGEVEGRTQGVLHVCDTGVSAAEAFDIVGFAGSFMIQLADGLSLDPDRLVTMTIGSDPKISFLGGA